MITFTGPSVVLIDEPCSAIDPTATAHIEALIRELRGDQAIVIITHNREQAHRVAERVAFFKMGYLLEVGPTAQVFAGPRHPETKAYLEGKFG